MGMERNIAKHFLIHVAERFKTMTTARETLELFFKDMCEWENDFSRAQENNINILLDDEFVDSKLEKLKLIYNKFLSDKSLEFTQERMETISFGEPAEYSQTIVKEQDSKDGIVFSTDKSGGEYARYLVINENNKWKIDKISFEVFKWKWKRDLF